MNNENQGKILKFPAAFLWGVSTSAYQIEGNVDNDWSNWEKSESRIKELKSKNLNPDDFICGRACDSYNRWEEDIGLVKNLNGGAYRFSAEWARIEPEQGRFDEAAIAHYGSMVKKLKELRIEPFLTLWHWTLPLWVRDIGGWENKDTSRHFLKYAEKLADSLGEDVRFWITLNEPQTYTGLSYVAGAFPPQIKSLFRANTVFKNLMQAHSAAYRMLKQKFKDKAQVGISHYVNYHTAYGNTLLNKALARLMDYLRWQRFIDSAEPCQDFIGFQYYHHDRVKFKPGGRFIIADNVNENSATNDMGWEIYPQGIYPLLKYLKRYNKPVYITENGTADADDDHRPRFINETLRHVQQAIREGVDVRGYFHWSLLDNFEWAHGWNPKFGLYEVDRRTFERKPRSSAGLYADICKNNGIMLE